MITSPQEANDILMKWYNEHTPITALFSSSGTPFAVKVSGYINGITSNVLISDSSREENTRPDNYLLVPTHDVQSYQYVEAKELGLSPEELAFVTTKEGAASLSLIFADGRRLSLFEREHT
jgi:hypothetical protein